MGRRFMVPILIGCSLLVSVAALMGISHLWQRETLTVRDVQGSPSALEPYQMTGNWGDDFHNLSFTLSQGEIQKDVSFERTEEMPQKREEWKVDIDGKEQYVRLEFGGQILLPTEDAEITADAGLPDTRAALERLYGKDIVKAGSNSFWGRKVFFRLAVYGIPKGRFICSRKSFSMISRI